MAYTDPARYDHQRKEGDINMIHPESLHETAAQVAALIPRWSWQLMDDDQRDDLLQHVVLPRYMSTTSDGTKLTPTWWSEQVGASPAAIKNRVIRLRSKGSVDPDAVPLAPSASDKGSIRGAKTALRKHPEMAAQLLNDPDVAAAIEDARHVIIDDTLDRRRKDVRRDKGPRGKTVTALDGTGVVLAMQAADRRMDEATSITEQSNPAQFSDEERALIEEYIGDVILKATALRSMLDGESWDDAFADMEESA